MEKELQGPEETLIRKYTGIHSEQHSRNYQIGKHQAMMAYMDSGFKNSLPSTTDWISR